MKNLLVYFLILFLVACGGKKKSESKDQGQSQLEQVPPQQQEEEILVTESGQEDKVNQIVINDGMNLFSKPQKLTLTRRRIITLVLHDFVYTDCVGDAIPTLHFSVDERDLARSQTLDAGTYQFLTEVNNPGSCRSMVVTFVVSSGGFARNFQ